MKPTRRTLRREFSSSREIFVPFGKMISLQKLFLANPVQMAPFEKKKSQRGLGKGNCD